MFKTIAFNVLPAYIFLGIFWLKNGIIDKVYGIVSGVISPETAYAGDTWAGWKDYIISNWDKNQVSHILLSPLYNILFPILIVLQCLPVILVIASLLNHEFYHSRRRPFLMRAAITSLCTTSVMLFSQTLAGASDGEYLWHLMGVGMILIIYLRLDENRYRFI